MSETKSIEERYEKTDDLLKRLLEYREPKPNTEEVYRQTRRLLKDLMAERGKMRELATKIDAYDFECEGGPMKNCVEWIALKESLNVQNK